MSKRTLCILTLTVLLLASSIPFIFPERSQVFFAKARGRETLIYPAKINLGSVEPGSEPITTFSRSFRAAGAPFYAVETFATSTRRDKTVHRTGRPEATCVLANMSNVSGRKDENSSGDQKGKDCDYRSADWLANVGVLTITASRGGRATAPSNCRCARVGVSMEKRTVSYRRAVPEMVEKNSALV